MQMISRLSRPDCRDFGEWRQAMEKRGLKVNLEKTKMMVTGGEMEDVLQVGIRA